MATALCRYPLDIGEHAVDEVITSLKFIPTVAEIVEACKRHMPAPAWTDEWEERSRFQLAERARLEAAVSTTERERIAEGFKQLLARLQPDKADNKANQYTPEAVKAKLGLTDEQWAAIPDTPPDSTWRKATTREAGP
jgi:tellurite resistance protein